MKKLTLIFAVGIAITYSVFSLHAEHSTPRNETHIEKDTVGKSARIALDSSNFDFGRVESGMTAQHEFIIRNTGTDTLVITSVRPSCGCTIVAMENTNVPPGAEGRLKVKFDSRNRAFGPFAKSIVIKSNAAKEVTQMLLHGVIFDPGSSHKGVMMHIDGLFSGDCRSCHVDKGAGKLGMAIYDADCAICHGEMRDSKPGPTLIAHSMMRHSASEWQTIISNGLANTNMPGFDVKHGGPLSKEQIASVIEFLEATKHLLSAK